ncbi:Zn-clus domain containing protein [Pyrenophora tritici-repentis]|uniref:Fungal Zn binuclear cluster domain containing protein n=1 Tax=Pyrenophora tritici-repentis TaxID=45151 RepID=A0A2W1D5F9_9PLEO|nr:Zn-clus domain-containing protein [Pyrenophora tritici-repentis]KAF7453721.1 Zn-clus domain containing protein [Pyrenophora tritici-repentis]KAI1520598.1 Fungal Zn binuclear cluster domain containing protein [Pyrenophora tritici-repentis]KAI1531818.1 Zn-clus domain containing protein [Pyrenophora tritici-repentis]KAI1534496.1 Zn-clus domain containing protein [Pyrenophora tritici-repentis]
MTMKLACLRCKRKKIKCDRADPICHQCITGKAECQYVERRQRPRPAQQKAVVQHLSQRLEMLEKQISASSDTSSPSESFKTPGREVVQKATPITSPKGSWNVPANGQDSWIYRLATDTRRNFQNQATPVATPTQSIDNAMLSLNEALDDLGKLRIRTDAINVDFKLSPVEARACIDGFVSVMNAMVIPDWFAPNMIDLELLRAITDVIDSPYVNIDPGVRVMYFNALYYGLEQSEGPGCDLAAKAYMKVLESVPAWLESTTEANADGPTAAMTSWTTIIMHDYELSWKFHCKSYQHIKSQGINQIDATPAKNFAEESQRNSFRLFYWHVMSVDVLFRLFYGKPTVVRWLSDNIRPPSIFTPDNMHPTAFHTMITITWIRYTVLTVEIIDYVDNRVQDRTDPSVAQKVNECCLQLEEMMEEWRLEELMDDQRTTDDQRCLIADFIMNVYTTIIGIQRLIKKSKPDEISLRAARKVSNIILDFQIDPTLNAKTKSITNHFITFYPFCVVFTLYEYILACPNPEDCESDIVGLENIGIAMTEACVTHKDLAPFAKTINALNRVSRTLQEERRKNIATPRATAAREGEEETQYHNNTAHGRVDQQPHQQQHPPHTSFDTIQNLVANELPDFDMSAFASMPDFSMNVEGDFQSHGFFRALENDLVMKNWPTGDWWDLSGGGAGGVNETMGQGPAR